MACCATSPARPATARPRARPATPAGNDNVGRSRTPPWRSAPGEAGRRHDPQRRSHREHQLGAPRRHPVRGAGQGVHHRAEQEVRGDDHQARQQRRGSRPGEPPVRLQHAAEHDADPVEDDLGGEDHEHACGRVRRPGAPRDAGLLDREQADDRPGEDPEEQASGSSSDDAQVSRADAVRSTSARSRRTSGAASTGTTDAASAPPATTSNRTFGSRLAVM